MELKKNCSEASLRKTILDTEKVAPLVTFQQLTISQNPILSSHPSMQNLSRIEDPTLKRTIGKSNFYESQSKSSVNLPPLVQFKQLILKGNFREIFPKVRIHSDYHATRRKKTEAERTNNFSCLGKKDLKKFENKSKALTKGRLYENYQMLRDNQYKCSNDIDQVSTPTFRNSAIPNNLAEKFSEMESTNQDYGNAHDISDAMKKNRSHTNLLCNNFKADSHNYASKLAINLNKMIQQNLHNHAKPTHQRIKILKHGLPKDVFTVDGKSGYK
ncbi:hypothetical protein SteCoe_22121 [Stentor coeruleus]|uniref:Uncharacterized protein n=1 Tax=Stentor coeruleus TaxID=5963 RepID=A0A1R2BMY6_9CILI|nr:hypothetical protein SteCoe_22121 [Stentor coeruleus]